VSDDVVLDASVAVKWVRDEPASAEALQLLEEHVLGNIHLWMPEQCVAELLAVTRRDKGPGPVADTWRLTRDAGLSIAPLSDDLVAEAARQCDLLSCTFYDALAPALAALLDARLCSADAGAHGAVEGVRLLVE